MRNPSDTAGMQDPASSATWATELLTQALEIIRPGRCWSGGSRIPAALPGDPGIISNPSPRLTIVLEGRCRHVLSRESQREAFPGAAGDALFYAPDAWSLRLADEPTRFVGLVFARDYLRVLEGVHRGGRTPTPATRHLHASALTGPGLRIVQALSLRADSFRGDASIDEHLVRALLLSAREHLLAPTSARSPGLGTWQAVHEYLLEHASDVGLSRDGVARRFHIHPSHLSDLCSRHGGGGFHAALETIRIARIRRMLLDGRLPIGEVMHSCGYADAGSGIRSFRRVMGCTPKVFRQGRGG
jgi:AraC-like DNA-binding protein